MIFFSILFVLPLMGRAEGVDFYKGSVAQAMDEARAQGKMLLVEFYASWSHKSRWMHQSVLSKSNVNQQFIVVSLDTSTEEGSAYAIQYEVSDYPVILVCTSSGVVIDKIDQTLEIADFEARLATAHLSTDKQSVRQLKQIFSLCESEDPQTRIKVNDLVKSYLVDQASATLLSQSHWDLFAVSFITYYGSASYDFLIRNVDQFFSPEDARSRIKTIVSDVVLPYIIGSEGFDEKFISKIEGDSLSLAYYPVGLDLCRLARLREQKQVTQYISLLLHVIDYVNEDYEYQLIMSLDFVADLLDKSDRTNRATARHLLEKLKQKSFSPSKTTLIESLLAKFS